MSWEAERRQRGAITKRDLQEAVKEVIHEQRLGITKNGESWSEWRAKAFTLPNLMILIATILSAATFVFSLGGRAVKLESASETALETAREAARVNLALTGEVAALRKFNDEQAATIRQQEEMHATKNDIRRVEGAVAGIRGDSRRALQEQLMPAIDQLRRRLDRIEQQVKQP